MDAKPYGYCTAKVVSDGVINSEDDINLQRATRVKHNCAKPSSI